MLSNTSQRIRKKVCKQEEGPTDMAARSDSLWLVLLWATGTENAYVNTSLIIPVNVFARRQCIPWHGPADARGAPLLHINTGIIFSVGQATWKM